MFSLFPSLTFCPCFFLLLFRTSFSFSLTFLSYSPFLVQETRAFILFSLDVILRTWLELHINNKALSLYVLWHWSELSLTCCYSESASCKSNRKSIKYIVQIIHSTRPWDCLCWGTVDARKLFLLHA
jgi:hypothetical protein